MDKTEARELSAIQHRMEKDLIRCGAAPTSVAYAMNALDPFHDVNMRVVGFPDSVGGKSVVQALTRQIEINVPAAIDGKWDAHITINPSQTGGNAPGDNNSDDHLWPVALLQSQSNSGTTDNNYLLPLYSAGSSTPTYTNYDTPTNVIPGGLLQVCAVNSGTTTFDPAVDAHYVSMAIDDVLQDNDSNSRIIGCAFEVHNTTEKLHKSGAVTVYRQDCQPDEPAVISSFAVARATLWNMQTNAFLYGPNNADNTSEVYVGSVASITHRKRRLPPTSVSVATQLHSATWEAAEGCLIPVTMDLEESAVPKRPSGAASLHVHDRNYAAATDLGGRSPFVAPYPSSIAPVNKNAGAKIGYVSSAAVTGILNGSTIETTCTPTSVLETNLNRSGAYFHGLSQQTTLTIILKVFVEQFPNPGSPFMPLASKSAPYDPKILHCMAEIYDSLAPGYPAHMNGMGDFFREVAAKVRSIADDATPYLTPALAALARMPTPMAQAIGRGGLAALAAAQQLPARAKANKIVVQSKKNGK